MRIRSIKPEFWSSPGLPADPWARLLYVAMWNWADDNGIGTANPRELLGFAFPNDDHLTIEDLRRMLVEIRRVFGVEFYTVAGRPYYSVPSWERHQKFDRRSKGRHPSPDQAEEWLYLEEQQDSAESHESPSNTRRDSVAGTEEQRNRGTEEQNSLSPVPSDEETREDVDRICLTLQERMVSNGVRKPTITKEWRREARLLIDKDGYPLDEILRVLEWSQADSFWKSNILSVPKFRQQFGQLLMKSKPPRPTNGQRYYGRPGERKSMF